MDIRKSLFYLTSLILVVSCETYSNSYLRNPQNVALPGHYIDSRFDQHASDAISRGVLDLAQRISIELEKEGQSSSQVFSPVSIASALTLLLLGSKGNTYQEILTLFGINQNQLFNNYPYKIHEEFGLLIEDLLNKDIESSRPRQQPPWKFTHREDYLLRRASELGLEPHEISVANALFVQNGVTLKPSYKAAVESIYKSEITTLDFARDGTGAQSYINHWVNEKTHGKIPIILADPASPDTSLLVTSALYFKGSWDKPFFNGATAPAEFYPDGPGGPIVMVKMMANGGVFPFYEAQEYGCKIIGLPYQGNLTTMYIIHPYASSRTRLRELQSTLTADKIEDMINRMARRVAIIALPKFHVQNGVNLRKIFKKMGVNSLFTQTNDLSLIAEDSTTQSPQPQYSSHAPAAYEEEPFIFARLSEDVDEETVKLTEDKETVKLTEDKETVKLTEDKETEDKETKDRTKRTVIYRSKRAVTYKVESKGQRLRLKDLIVNKRITKLNPGKKSYRHRREAFDPSENLKQLDVLRKVSGLTGHPLLVDEIIHKVDLVVHEKGTEGGAATAVTLRRTGPEVSMRLDTPFLILIRHDTTKLPLFYGAIYEPKDF